MYQSHVDEGAAVSRTRPVPTVGDRRESKVALTSSRMGALLLAGIPVTNLAAAID